MAKVGVKIKKNERRHKRNQTAYIKYPKKAGKLKGKGTATEVKIK